MYIHIPTTNEPSLQSIRTSDAHSTNLHCCTNEPLSQNWWYFLLDGLI